MSEMTTPARRGPKPIHGQAMTAAERMRQMRERRRREEAEADARMRAEMQRKAQLARDCRRALGALLNQLPTNGYMISTTLQSAGWTEDDWPECQDHIQRIIRALAEGKDRIP